MFLPMRFIIAPRAFSLVLALSFSNLLFASPLDAAEGDATLPDVKTEQLPLGASDLPAELQHAYGIDTQSIDSSQYVRQTIPTAAVLTTKPAIITDSAAVPEAVTDTPTTDLSVGIQAEIKDVLENIPAGSLPSQRSYVQPKHDVNIDKESIPNPFPNSISDEAIDANVGVELGLTIEIKEADHTIYDNLKYGYDALLSGQLESAIAYYKKVLDQEPLHKDALFGLATAYHVGKQYEQAYDAYLDVIALDQNYKPALNNFFILASQYMPENAIEHLEDVQKHNPEFAPLVAQLGLIYARQEQYGRAIHNLNKAIMLDPDNLDYRYHLAVILDHMGESELAIKMYDHLLLEHRKGADLIESPEAIYTRRQALAGMR